MIPMVPMAYAIACRARERVGGSRSFSRRLRWRVSTNPAAWVPAYPAMTVATYWRPRPCGSAIAFTASARSLAVTGVAP